MTTNAPLFSTWLDDFFLSYYSRRPVNASFIGRHEYDHLLPDYSTNGIADTMTEMTNLLDRLQHLPDEPLTPAMRIDRKLAEGFLRIQLWEFQSSHFQQANPSVYTGEAIFSLMSLFLTDYAPTSQRVEAAIERMNAIPTLLAQGKDHLRQSPPAWVSKAIDECNGSLTFLQDGIHHLVRQYDIQSPRFLEVAQTAAKAFLDFKQFLEDELRKNPGDQLACGEETLDLLMRQGHFLPQTGQELIDYASDQMREARAKIEQAAAQLGASSWQKAIASLADIHPSTDDYLKRYQQLWDECHALAEANHLLTWPEFPIRYISRPLWARKAAPDLYFLFYRAPAAFNRPPIHNYLVTPIEADMPLDEQEKLLRSTNDSVIKLNHVVHHGSIGHHVQNWHAYHSESRIGQIAAVDCASRIAMFCGLTMAEGWACYATDLVSEYGFLTPLERFSELQSRLRMCARAIVDIQFHSRKFNLDQAVKFYETNAGMSHSAAYAETIKNSMNPGAAMIYIAGHDRIKQLRKNIANLSGPQFSLQRFHDEFLSYGSIPVALISEEMERKANHVAQ